MFIQKTFPFILTIIWIMPKWRIYTLSLLFNLFDISLLKLMATAIIRCCCLKCLFCRLLLSILLSGGHRQLLSIVTCRNFMFATNKCFYNSLGQRQWTLYRKLLRFPKKLAGFRNYVSVLKEFIRSYSLTQLLWY